MWWLGFGFFIVCAVAAIRLLFANKVTVSRDEKGKVKDITIT